MILHRAPVVLLSICLAVGTASAVEIREDIQETFDVSPGAILELHHGDGNLTLTPWDQDRVEFRIIYQADIVKLGFGARPDFDVIFHHSGNRVLAKEEVRGTTTFGFYSRHTITYTWEIKAPPWVTLEIHGDDGDVRITGWREDMELWIDDGDLVLDDIAAGHIGISLDDGDFEGNDIKAALQIVSDDGDVHITGLTGPEMELASDDGDIDLSFEGPAPDRLKVATDDGDVWIRFPGTASFAYDIRTDDGRIRLNLPGDRRQDIPADGGRISGAVGGGAGSVIIHTDDGNVELIAE